MSPVNDPRAPMLINICEVLNFRVNCKPSLEITKDVNHNVVKSRVFTTSLGCPSD